jgi:hypothetical protein
MIVNNRHFIDVQTLHATAKHSHTELLLAPVFWLKDGKANLKSKLAEAAPIEATTLP